MLAQLHGVTSDGDAEDEQQEDMAVSSQGKEHRRPHSAGNLVEQAAASSSGSSHRAGRPPLAETTANNKLGLKVHIHLSSSPHSLIHSLAFSHTQSGVTRRSRQHCSYLGFKPCCVFSSALLAGNQQRLYVASIRLCPVLSVFGLAAYESATCG